MRYAIRNLVRIPQRTLIMLTVLFTVLLLIMWSVLASALCERAIDSRLGVLDGAVRITDGNAISPDGKVGINMRNIRRFDEGFDIIEGFSAYLRTSCSAEGIDPIVSSKATSSSGYGNHMLYACSSSDMLEAFMSGSLELVKGTPLTVQNDAEQKCKILISEALAKTNGLEVGSTFKIKIRYSDGYNQQSTEETFTVGGIFRVNDFYESADIEPLQLIENNLYIPLSTYYGIIGVDHISPTEAYFYLTYNDPETISALETRMHEFGFYDIKLVSYTPESITAGISRLLTLVRLTAMLLTICGLVAFLIMILINLQSRTRELGVLTALGKPRGRTVRSFFFEILLISIAALLIALLIFAATASIGGNMIGSFLGSDRMNDTPVNTTAMDFFNAEENEMIRYDLAPILIRSALIALASASATLCAAFVMIRIYLHKLDVIRVLGGGVG